MSELHQENGKKNQVWKFSRVKQLMYRTNVSVVSRSRVSVPVVSTLNSYTNSWQEDSNYLTNIIPSLIFII